MMYQLAARLFLSTLSLRRATVKNARSCLNILISIHALLAESDNGHETSPYRVWDFYPRSPCGERPLGDAGDCTATYFYPRSPCGERRRVKRFHAADISDFYPRSPCGERLGPLIFNVQPRNFYPRSPCGERLFTTNSSTKRAIHFYPRSPCGERHN